MIYALAWSQDGTQVRLKGRVTGEDGSPVSFCMVRIVGQGAATAANIDGVTSCVTRLRVGVRDRSLVASEGEFAASPGVRGVVLSGNAEQVIVGKREAEVCECVQQMVDVQTAEDPARGEDQR